MDLRLITIQLLELCLSIDDVRNNHEDSKLLSEPEWNEVEKKLSTAAKILEIALLK